MIKNPPHDALRAAVNRAIANGAPAHAFAKHDAENAREAAANERESFDPINDPEAGIGTLTDDQLDELISAAKALLAGSMIVTNEPSITVPRAAYDRIQALFTRQDDHADSDDTDAF